ncbi:MAG: hypothetical protein IT180_02380 [Acidobacteria bacterium]|nr:hypothetical protein [Acidobacteriota bacterium]
MRDVMIPARDGVRLNTKIFTPRNQVGVAGTEVPALLRTEVPALRNEVPALLRTEVPAHRTATTLRLDDRRSSRTTA